MCLQPSGSGQIQNGRSDNAFAKTSGRHTEVFVGIVQLLPCLFQSRISLVELRFALPHLKHDHLLGIIVGVLLDFRFRLCHSRLVVALAPMENRDFGHHAEIPHTAKLVLEAVEARRVANHIVAESTNRGQIVGTHHSHLFGINVVGQTKTFQFGSVGLDFALRKV